MPRMITVLEDSIRYRDRKKWKRRNCFITKPDIKKGTVTMFITKQYGSNVSIQDIDEKSTRQYLIDEITGFEHGRHVDKESYVMALIGCNLVYCIAFEHTDTMFRWAETLSKLLRSVNFHVTLKRVSETCGVFNKITVGTQGNLHVQQSRLCLIGEPADGNKFICEWSMANLISVNIDNTTCEKTKKLTIKSNGKTNKGKGNFEFEIGLTQSSVFESAFSTFLTACQVSNPQFRTNYLSKLSSSHINTVDTSISYPISLANNHNMIAENGASIEKRSSEIPIPRSREHSGPDQRPVETNVQIKLRNNHKNLHNAIRYEPHKHYSVIETTAKSDNDVCLFADDEEIEEQVHHRSQNPLCRCLSQESSGVFVNGPADSMREGDLSSRLSVQNDSGCNPHSTSCTGHDIDHLRCYHHNRYHHQHGRTLLPQCQLPLSSPNNNLLLSFYRNVYRNPLSLTNYTNYYRLLRTVSYNRCTLLKRSNSYNCVHLPEMKLFEYSRKFSYQNLPLNSSAKGSEQHFQSLKEKINSQFIDDTFFCVHSDRDLSCDDDDENEDCHSSKVLLSNRLPFRSMKDFHYSMMGSLHSGSVCFSLFSYHHFLTLLKHVKTLSKNCDNKMVTDNDSIYEYRNLKDKLRRKNKVYNQWLEKMRYFGTHSWDTDVKEPSIVDINIMLVFEIIDSLLGIKSVKIRGFGGDVIPRHKSIFDTTPTIELNDDMSSDHVSPDFSTGNNSSCIDSRPHLSMSCSTPNFCNYHHQQQQTHHQEPMNNVTGYLNLSTINHHTFPKYNNNSLHTPDSVDNKEGSFKRFRRKYSPNVFIPLLRRKTSSPHSTISEPICHHDSTEQSSYYNMANHRDTFNKKSLSVVLDCGPYINMNQDSKYINIARKPGTTAAAVSNGSCNYINTRDQSIDDDNTPYPDEIIDPSINYGDLNFIQSKMRPPVNNYSRHDSSIDNFRRSSLSILSQKSLQSISPGSHCVSFNKRGCSNISRVHSDACNNSSSNFRSTEYINVKTLGLSPQCRTLPPSLNYVTVMGLKRGAAPLSIYTEHDSVTNHKPPPHTDPESDHSRNYRRTWLSPQTSPVVDYCQIDLRCTYALRDVDQRLYDKLRTSSLQNHSPPDDGDSMKSADHRTMSDNYSITSSKKSSSHKYNKKTLCRLFSRKT